jgi:rfaE bifunctional protein kinase chain/domain
MNEPLQPERLEEILRRFRGCPFLVVGDVMLDRYVYGEVERISPEAPVPVVKVGVEEERLGGAANVANNLAALGADVQVCGVIGDDSDGESVVAGLRARGIGSNLLLRHPGRPTTRKIRIIAHQQQVVRIDHEEDTPLDGETEDALLRFIHQSLPAVKGVILSDYGKGVVTERIIRGVVEAGKDAQVFVDPKVKRFSLYQGVTLVTPNTAEAGHAAGEKIVDEASLLRVGRRLLELLPGTAVLLTRGAQGMSLFEADGSVSHVGTTARRVYDVTGAGDTVISTFALASCSGASHREAAVLANGAAGMVVGEAGAATVDADGLRCSLRGV